MTSRTIVYFEVRFSVQIGGRDLAQLVVRVRVKQQQVGRKLLIGSDFDYVTALQAGQKLLKPAKRLEWTLKLLLTLMSFHLSFLNTPLRRIRTGVLLV